MPPNIVFVLTDDQRWDSLHHMPALDADPAWARFSESYVNHPLCCPARATALTGRYAHHHGVETLIDGTDLDESTTIATMLQGAGYRTGMFGKYLNGYPFGAGHVVPPGWDDFRAYEGGTRYFDYRLNENGTVVAYGDAPEDYSTDVLAEQAKSFIRAGGDQPFFVYLSFNAPHLDGYLPIPAPRHAHGTPIAAERRPNFDRRDTVSQPAWMDDSPDPDPFVHDVSVAVTHSTLQSVDEQVVALSEVIDECGHRDDTYIIFTSDNGYSFGEHRLMGKGHLYEESVRVPLLVKGPGVRPGVVDRLTSNIDLVPTMLEWAGVTAPEGFVDGASFAASIAGADPGEQPDAVLFEGCRTQGGSGQAVPCGGHPEDMGMNWGLRTRRHKYIENRTGELQLFDLVDDPYELTNLAGDPEHAGTTRSLHEQLIELRDR